MNAEGISLNDIHEGRLICLDCFRLHYLLTILYVNKNGIWVDIKIHVEFCYSIIEQLRGNNLLTMSASSPSTLSKYLKLPLVWSDLPCRSPAHFLLSPWTICTQQLLIPPMSDALNQFSVVCMSCTPGRRGAASVWHRLYYTLLENSADRHACHKTHDITPLKTGTCRK